MRGSIVPAVVFSGRSGMTGSDIIDYSTSQLRRVPVWLFSIYVFHPNAANYHVNIGICIR